LVPRKSRYVPFEAEFIITTKIARALMRIEGARHAIQYLPITPFVLPFLDIFGELRR